MSLIRVGTVSLPEHIKEGGFDHAAIHAGMDRLYVAHTANDSLDIIDCAHARYIGSMRSLAGVAGVLVAEEQGLVFTSNRGEDTVGIFSAGEEGALDKIAVGVRPNGLAFDPLTGLLLVANVGDPLVAGSFTISLVDICERKMVASIPVAGRSRWAVFYSTPGEFFVNISDPPQIIVIDAYEPDQVSRTIDIQAAGPHGLDLDTQEDRLFCACDAGKLFAMEASTGDILGKADLSGKPDVIFFNPLLKHLYVAIGDPGIIEVFDTSRLSHLETVSTEPGAHTLAFDQRYNKVYAFGPQSHSALVFQDASPSGGDSHI